MTDFDMTNEMVREPHWMDVAGLLQEGRAGRWVSFSFFQPEDLPQTSACYVIMVENRVAYVGQTKNLRTRFKGHGIHRAYDPRTGYNCWVTPWGCFLRSMLHFKRRVSERHGDWLMQEARLIRRLRPLWNRVGVDDA